ncbi:MAG: DEDD exonuclease domain-containing protein [Flaviflexus sp.]|nr:DEDD exonuclease domain-containing protein [Flaviflexus sp.]
MATRLTLPHKGQGQLSFDDLGTPLERTTFVVVDLETTGGRPGAEEITEIGAVKSRGGQIIGEFATLINPGRPIPPFITHLTGITTAMVYGAPRIHEVLPTFLEFLGAGPDTVFVAHNARFDLGHLRAAARAWEVPFPKMATLDTVALARRLITRDETPNYKLGTLAGLVGTSVSPTHRALDDAKATEELLQFLLERLGPLGVTHMEDLATVTDPVPLARRQRSHLADQLPTGPGVYRFLSRAGDVLYVGSSVNVRSRVRQYFTAAEKRHRMGEMVDLTGSVEATSCATELEARVLELREIAAHDPAYNRRSRRPGSRPWLILTDEPHPRLSIVRSVPADAADRALGPFSSHRAARRAKDLIERTTRIRTCTRRLPAAPGAQARACALADMGKCSAPCLTGEPQNALAPVREILSEDVDAFVTAVLADIRVMAEAEQFEWAAEARDGLRSIVRAAARKERLTLMTREAEIRATRRSRRGWDIISVRRGRLAGTAHTTDAQAVLATADTLGLTAQRVDPPKLAFQAAHLEETDLLFTWLCEPGTRLLTETEHPFGLARRSPARHRIGREDPSGDEMGPGGLQ